MTSLCSDSLQQTSAVSTTSPGQPSANRNVGFDALRAAVTILVIFHHAAITYGAIGGWYYKEVQPNEGMSGRLLVLFCTTNQAWFMGLFFLLAGYFTPPALNRRGTRGFVLERLLRLGVPLAVYVVLLHPLTVALAQTANGFPFTRAVVFLFAHGKLEPGPLWFAEALLIFTVAYLMLLRCRPDRVPVTPRCFPSDRVLFSAALVTGATAFVLRLAWPVGVNVGFLQLGYFASYILLYAAGCAAAHDRLLEKVPREQQRRWLYVALAAFPVFPLVIWGAPFVPWLSGRAEGGWNVQALVYAVWEPLVAWGIILGLIGIFKTRFSDVGPVWRRLARRAFLIYIIHPPILVAVALAWRILPAPALVKFVVSGAAASMLCYMAAGLLLRVKIVARVV